MAIVKWRFNNNESLDFTLDINPASDTGWQEEIIAALKHPIGRKWDILQIGGLRGRTRSVEGITKDLDTYIDLRDLLRKVGVFELTDHRGGVYNAFLVEFSAQELLDASNLNATFKYKMKILRRPDSE